MATTQEAALSHSEQQAAAQLESIKEMVAALECDYDRRESLHDDLLEAFDDEAEQNDPKNEAAFLAWVKNAADDSWHTLNDAAIELQELNEAAGECKDREDAEQRISEDPLSVQVRGGWHDVGAEDEGPEEFEILLCTGGPACKLLGDLEGGEPSRVRLMHQDWGTPWTEWITNSDDQAVMLTYCRQFLFVS